MEKRSCIVVIGRIGASREFENCGMPVDYEDGQRIKQAHFTKFFFSGSRGCFVVGRARLLCWRCSAGLSRVCSLILVVPSVRDGMKVKKDETTA